MRQQVSSMKRLPSWSTKRKGISRRTAAGSPWIILVWVCGVMMAPAFMPATKPEPSRKSVNSEKPLVSGA